MDFRVSVFGAGVVDGPGDGGTERSLVFIVSLGSKHERHYGLIALDSVVPETAR